MKLTGKAKEEFEKWLESQVQQVNIWSWQFNGFDLELFYKLPFSMQYGVYVDFFDSNKILIEIYFHNAYNLAYSVNYPNKELKVISDKGFDSRQEAREQAIKKANEIFNNK